ncbi:MAG: acyl-CoA dehydrogenase family protein [Alphaproteobacteria bacterium]|nr:acyl-CoA dehydrogenase family protein [Alphaproteobacteria bacterium]
MDFDFTPEQDAIRDTARRFARERLAPGYAAREASGRIDRDLVREMGALGLIAPELPQHFGGLDAGGVTSGIIIEEVSYADLNVGYICLLSSLNGFIVASHARPDIAQTLVPRIIAGESIVALALTEPGGGSDAASLTMSARRDGSSYVLKGEKTSISLVTQADHAIVFARTGQPGERARGVTAFLVPMDAAGISRSAFTDVGSAAVGRGSIFFDEVRVDESCRLGSDGAGFHQVMNGFDYSRALIGLQVLAAAQASLDETWKYITERHAFGNPLARYQGVTEPLAEAETLMSAAKLLCYKALWLRDQGRPHTAEAAMVKWWAPKLAFETTHRCLLTHGHSGYSRDLPHQQRLRDVLGLMIGDGTEQIQKMIVAREKVGRVAVPY